MVYELGSVHACNDHGGSNFCDGCIAAVLRVLVPPDVRKSLEMTVASPPVTWLTNNYVHESWRLLGNLGGYFVCTLICIALIPALAVLGFDPRWVKRFSVVTHLAALMIIPPHLVVCVLAARALSRLSFTC